MQGKKELNSLICNFAALFERQGIYGQYEGDVCCQYTGGVGERVVLCQGTGGVCEGDVCCQGTGGVGEGDVCRQADCARSGRAGQHVFN